MTIAISLTITTSYFDTRRCVIFSFRSNRPVDTVINDDDFLNSRHQRQPHQIPTYGYPHGRSSARASAQRQVPLTGRSSGKSRLLNVIRMLTNVTERYRKTPKCSYNNNTEWIGIKLNVGRNVTKCYQTLLNYSICYRLLPGISGRNEINKISSNMYLRWYYFVT